MSGLEFVLVGLAAMAGGGTLTTFPMLVALGIPAVASNVTNTVATCPGYSILIPSLALPVGRKCITSIQVQHNRVKKEVFA